MRIRFPLVAGLFIVSGATGLLYEVAFSKLLAYIFGATAYAVSTVLAAFMAGLALGAHLGGKYAGRVKRPLAVYGALEIAVGVVCALTPALFGALTDAYVAVARSAPEGLAALTVARAALTGIVVAVPTVAMGATLPLLSRVIGGAGAEGARLAERRLAVLYAINTAGGALGALTSAYAALPALGIRGTMWAAATANGIIGVIAIIAGAAADTRAVAVADTGTGTGTDTDTGARTDTDTDTPAPAGAGAEAAETSTTSATEPATAARAAAAAATDTSASPRLFLALAFTSGFLVFAAEVVETHLLALLIGNSAYAFGLMLAVFLVCLSLGAARAPAFARRHGQNALFRGLAAAAISIAITLPLWDLLPLLFGFAGKHVSSWAGRELVRALAALGILALPTFWMGSTFPLLLLGVASRPDVAARVGRFTVANTLGTIAGSIITGYVVLPWLGSQRALSAVAAAFAVASIAAARAPGTSPKEPSRALAASAAAIALAFLLPRWDMARLTSGANVYFALGAPPEQIHFVREDVHGGVTTVAERKGVLTMYTNGKFQGDNGPEMPAQRRFAHFPSLFVADDRRALVIGLGTGTTLGTIAAYPYERIDVAEISPAIVEASRRFFEGPSRGALDDPRVHLTLNDGRNVLLVAQAPYDLITIELTSVWFAGAASLYSREFYELTKARLTPGGVLQQWVQLHHIRRRELATIIRTLRGVFPHVALFVGGAQGILVASAEPLRASEKHLAELFAMPSIRSTLGEGVRLPDLFGEMMFSGPELERFVRDAEADGGPIVSTDDNLYLEYATPKGNVLDYGASLRATLALFEEYRTPDPKARHLVP